MQKAVIFDLDGTLLDTVPDIKDNINIMLKKFGLPLRTKKEICSFVGHGARNLVEQSIGKNSDKVCLDDALSYYNKIYTESNSPKTKLFDGIDEVLKTLKARGYKILILTNKPQETTDIVYEKYLKQYNFDKVVGQRNGIKIKPDKTATLNILKELGVLPENTYFVGDGETDVQTSVNAKTIGIAVLWGYRDKQVLSSFGAKTFADKPLDLLKLIP